MKRFVCSLSFIFTVFFGYTQTDQHIDYPVSCHGEIPDHVTAPGFLPPAPIDTDGLRSDTFDIIHYKISADLTAPPFLSANTIVFATSKMDGMNKMTLDLLDLTVDSVMVNGEIATFSYDGFQIFLDLPNAVDTGEEIEVHVFYQGNPTRDASGFGGLVYESGYIYNLGIGLVSNPHNYGRGWFPCFDNFKERSTYEIIMKHSSSINAHAVGTELSVIDNGDGTTTTTYAMDQEITTYQTSISIADYHTMWSTHEGVYGDIDIKLMAKPQDSSAMKGSMGNLPAALDCIESWYGPYVWERVGYVATTVGAMEHPTHIAYPINSINGNAVTNNRLMSHELTHNWFGNLITLSTERDMWIKEGPAEYGAHLTSECLYGKEEFLEVVKSNHNYVLKSAHIDDEQFRALSGMPNEFTYGTHTYRKGASVIHNLRGYLGDTLFSKGMTSILENYAYSHLDAQKFQDQITETTGMDMKPFFDAWILNPGFSVFVEDSVSTTDMGNGTYESTVYIQQKLYGTSIFHNETPLSLHLYGYNGEVDMQMIEAAGQFSEVNVVTGFDVKRVVFNRDNLLNQARLAHDNVLTSTGTQAFDRTDIIFKLESLTEDLNVRVEHVLGKPDNNLVEGELELTDKHYWRVLGDFAGDYSMTLRFPYKGKNPNDLDYPLTTISEDSILLFYRPDASIAWEPTNADLLKFNPNDGAGTIELENALPGDYSIGKGIFNVSSNENLEFDQVEIFPNPASHEFFVNFDEAIIGLVKVIDLQGRVLLKKNIFQDNSINIDVSGIYAGQYFIEIENTQNSNKTIRKLVIVK